VTEAESEMMFPWSERRVVGGVETATCHKIHIMVSETRKTLVWKIVHHRNSSLSAVLVAAKEARI
jgi:hypothetical protein